MRAYGVRLAPHLTLVLAVIQGGCFEMRLSAADAKNTCGLGDDWDDVLATAKTRSSDSRRRLESIAARGDDVPAVALARQVLTLWSDKDNTFYSLAPIAVRKPELPPAGLRGALGRENDAAIVVVEADIDASGCVGSVRVIKGPTSDKLRSLVIRSVQQTAFQPAKRGDDYVAAKATLSIGIEVR